MKINDDDEINDFIYEDRKGFHDFLEKIIFIIDLIFAVNIFRINYLPEEPLKFFKEIDSNKKDSLNAGLKIIIDFVKELVGFLTEYFMDILKFIKLDNCLITFLYMKHKNSFALDINAIGLTNFDNEII